jgi:hypothetical protein
MEHRLTIEDAITGDERRLLEAVRLIALARDLLNSKRERVVRENLDEALERLGYLYGGEPCLPDSKPASS